MTATRCANRKCRGLIADDESAHWVHDSDCDRMLDGVCRCEGSWWCQTCCPDEECTALQAALLLAREDVRARAEAAEIAAEEVA